MKRLLSCVGIALLAVGLVLVGCEKKTGDEVTPTDQPATAKVDTAKPAEPAKSDVPSADEIKKATDDAAKMLAAAGGGEAPEYMKKMVEHLKAMNQIMKDNLDSCDKVAAELTQYTKDHEAELGELKKQAEDDQAKMTDEQKMKMAGSVMALIAPIMQDMVSTQSQFAQKCPEQAVAVNEAMKAVRVK